MSETSGKHDTLLRHWQMLRAIPRYPAKITARALHAQLQSNGFDVTKRSVERDLASLSEVFPIHSDERDKPYGWSWGKEAIPFDVPSLGNCEALAFKLIEQFLQGLMPHAILAQLAPYFRMAEQRLAALPKESGVPAWTSKIRVVQPTQPLIPPKINPKVQQAVSDALLTDHQIMLRYRRHGEEKINEYLAHPLALVQRGAITYLLATLFDYTDVRLLAMHRISSAAIQDERSRRPKGFDIDAYIQAGRLGFGDGELIRLEVIFSSAAAEHLYETPLSADQEITPVDDERVRVTATVARTEQLEWWLLAFGDNVEVTKPARLREEMGRQVIAASKKYQN